MAVNFLFVSRLVPHLLDTCRLLVACLLLACLTHSPQKKKRLNVMSGWHFMDCALLA
jgi:hypothetical protein